MLNKVQLIGHLGGDPEIRTVGDSTVAQFSLATSERYKGKDGQVKEMTEWHSIVMWGNLADIAKKYMQKGSKVYIEGKLKTRSWENNKGEKKYQTDIVANQVLLLDSKKDSSRPSPAPAPVQTTPVLQGADLEDKDDDLPF